MDTKQHTYPVLSIDAWADGAGGWQWNSWQTAGTWEGELPELNRAGVRQILRRMRADGYLSAYSAGRVAVEDDQYNLVICDRHTGEPHFAIEYGAQA